MNKSIAIVTGTSRLKGIGKAICLELAKQGCDIFFTYWTDYDKQMPWSLKDDEPSLIQKELENYGIKCKKLELDLTQENSIGLLFQEVEKEFGTASILVNNATYSTMTSIDNINAKELDKHYELNIKATTLLSAEFIKRFNYKEGGRIINITSGQSLGPMPNEIAYAMTKSAIEMLTYTLASEIAAKGITINAINPGPNDTGWMDQELKEKLRKQFPMGRIGNPSDTANLVGYLVKKEAAWITGQIIHSEGGFKR